MRRTLTAIAFAAAAAMLWTAPAAAHPDWWDQRDRPGDFRCDAYWDRGRDDCDAAWRTRYLRHDGRDYRHDGHRHHRRARYWEPRPRHAPPVWRDPARMDWCARTYRSWDPYTGYYLGYSGRYHFCG